MCAKGKLSVEIVAQMTSNFSLIYKCAMAERINEQTEKEESSGVLLLMTMATLACTSARQ